MTRTVACRPWTTPTSTLHVKEVAEQGYTIVEDAIEPELVDALHDATSTGSSEFFEVAARRRTRSRATTRCASTTCSRTATSVEQIPVHRARAADRRGRARPGLPHLVAVVDRHRPGRDARSRSTPTTSSSRSRSRTRRRCATRCGRSPTSPRRTARPASSPARTSPTTPPTTARTTTRSPAEMPKGIGARLARQPVARRRRQHAPTSAASASR